MIRIVIEGETFELDSNHGSKLIAGVIDSTEDSTLPLPVSKETFRDYQTLVKNGIIRNFDVNELFNNAFFTDLMRGTKSMIDEHPVDLTRFIRLFVLLNYLDDENLSSFAIIFEYLAHFYPKVILEYQGLTER